MDTADIFFCSALSITDVCGENTRSALAMTNRDTQDSSFCSALSIKSVYGWDPSSGLLSLGLMWTLETPSSALPSLSMMSTAGTTAQLYPL